MIQPLPLAPFDPLATYTTGDLVAHGGGAWLVAFAGQLDGVVPGTDDSWVRVLVQSAESPAAGLVDAHALWPDSDTIPEATLAALLNAAWEGCAAYLPAEQLDPFPALVPYRWTQANVLHARDTWTAYRHDGGVIGFDAYAVRVRPLSDTVKALLRPPRGKPLVG